MFVSFTQIHDPLVASPSSHIQVDRVTKAFDRKTVLNNLSLEILPGEFIVVVGKSGCGKSTLLRLLAGLDIPSQGKIQIDGNFLLGLNPRARVMFQDSRLLPWKSVLDNVILGLDCRSRAQGHWALHEVGLGDRARDWPTVLSGGQQQRVALARALVSQPQLLLLDEPLGALDALTRLDMQRLISDLWRQQGFTAVLVTHDVEEAVLLADRVIVIQDGQINANIPIQLPRPRSISSVQVAELKQRILCHILQG
jgi:sulfonate transport system ATP-binding protein